MRTRPDIACATSRAESLITHDPDTCLIRVKHNLSMVASFNGPKRQDLIAKSTCEAESIPSSEALQQGENIAIVVAEMTNRSCEIEVSIDNAASLHMIWKGSETAWRTRRVSVKPLWMHQMARRGIKFTYQSTAEKAADSLTKGLGNSSKTSMSCSYSTWLHSMSFRELLVVHAQHF